MVGVGAAVVGIAPNEEDEPRTKLPMANWGDRAFPAWGTTCWAGGEQHHVIIHTLLKLSGCDTQNTGYTGITDEVLYNAKIQRCKNPRALIPITPATDVGFQFDNPVQGKLSCNAANFKLVLYLRFKKKLLTIVISTNKL